MRIKVIAIGSPFGADRVAWLVVEHLIDSGLLARFPAGLIETVILDRPGAALLDRLRDADPTVLIDAMRSGARPGSLRRLDAGDLCEMDPRVSTHGMGVAETLALGYALGEISAPIVLYGIEIGPPPDPGDTQPIPAWLAAPAVSGIAEKIMSDIKTFVNDSDDKRA